jgi:hypothetical protein
VVYWLAQALFALDRMTPHAFTGRAEESTSNSRRPNDPSRRARQAQRSMGRPRAVCGRAEEASVAGRRWCRREQRRGQRRGSLNERALTASCHARTALRSSEAVCVRCAGGAARIEVQVRRVEGRGLRGPSKSSERARTRRQWQGGCVGRRALCSQYVSAGERKAWACVRVCVCATTGRVLVVSLELVGGRAESSEERKKGTHQSSLAGRRLVRACLSTWEL